MRIFKLVIILSFSALFFNNCSNNNNALNKCVIVEFDYGEARSKVFHTVKWSDNQTALEATQLCGVIVTQAIKNEFIMIIAIDSVSNFENDVWYYNVNNKRADKFSNLYYTSPNDTITWIYTKNVCSVEKCK